VLDIEGNLKAYLGARNPTARYTSFDYCFNHFQAHREAGLAELASPSAMELSCLHLGFYLASWGMLRGSSILLQRSVRHFVPLIEAVASTSPTVWGLDVDAYTDDAIDALIETANHLRSALPDLSSNILLTKIMLGVFGCVPAFDTYFKKGLGVATFGRKSLRKIAGFYHENAEIIDAYRVPTLDFATGTKTSRRYTRAKVIDMIFFIEGGRSTSSV